MSDQWPAAPAPDPTHPARYAAPSRERVGLGLLAASGAVVAGVVLTAVLWRIGFIAALTSYLIAAGAVFLYAKAAGVPRKGLVPLVGLIIVGIAGSFYAAYLSDLFQAYSELGVADLGISRWAFLADNPFHVEFVTDNGAAPVLFLAFGALGAWRTLAALMARGRG